MKLVILALFVMMNNFQIATHTSQIIWIIVQWPQLDLTPTPQHIVWGGGGSRRPPPTVLWDKVWHQIMYNHVYIRTPSWLLATIFLIVSRSHLLCKRQNVLSTVSAVFQFTRSASLRRIPAWNGQALTGLRFEPQTWYSQPWLPVYHW